MIAATAFLLLLLAAIIQTVFILKKSSSTDPFSHYLVLAASLLLFGLTVYRSIVMQFVAVTNTFESLVFFSAVICLLIFFYRFKTKKQAVSMIQFGGTLAALVLLAVASSPIAPKAIEPPIPALRSYWLVLHVTFSFIGESFFTLSFVSAVIYLFTKNKENKKKLEQLTANLIAVGYPVFTAGALIFGAVWARYAWGSFWSWDPKETWALVTWLVYTAYLHARFVRRLKGSFSAILAVSGFLFTIFTFFGVNFLLSGLHSYG